jgi:hypothetical protein
MDPSRAAELNRAWWDAVRRQRDAGLIAKNHDVAAQILAGESGPSPEQLAFLGDVAGKRLLDLGCGDGCELVVLAPGCRGHRRRQLAGPTRRRPAHRRRARRPGPARAGYRRSCSAGSSTSGSPPTLRGGSATWTGGSGRCGRRSSRAGCSRSAAGIRWPGSSHGGRSRSSRRATSSRARSCSAPSARRTGTRSGRISYLRGVESHARGDRDGGGAGGAAGDAPRRGRRRAVGRVPGRVRAPRDENLGGVTRRGTASILRQSQGCLLDVTARQR